MTHICAVFRSRSQAIDCVSRLRRLRVAAKLINTPRDANVGCGLSVMFSSDDASRVRNVIKGANYSAFYGFLTMR